jgi:acetyl esterase/lipase
VTDPRDVLEREATPPDAVIRYGTMPEQVADVRLPDHDRGRLVVLMHGGFWREAWDRAHTRPMADGLVAAGYAVTTPEFARTGGRGGWPTTFEDVALAVARVPALVSELPADRVDATRPLLLGHSAGGHLALWCAGKGLVNDYAGVVALAPVADLAAAYRRNLDDGAVAALLGGSPDDLPERYEQADPSRLPPPSVPVVVVHGTDDAQVPIELSRRYVDHAGAEMRPLPGVEHFGLIDPLSSAWAAVLAAVRSLPQA